MWVLGRRALSSTPTTRRIHPFHKYTGVAWGPKLNPDLDLVGLASLALIIRDRIYEPPHQERPPSQYDSRWRDLHFSVTNSKGQVSKPLTPAERRFKTSPPFPGGRDLTSFNSDALLHGANALCAGACRSQDKIGGGRATVPAVRTSCEMTALFITNRRPN